jgi:L-iditol 2-dehydrogenase
MKAMVLTANQQMELTHVTLTPLPADHCRIRVSHVGVCSSDIQRSCENGAYAYPLVMGHELAGTIIECGSDVTGFAVDERVVIFPLLPCFHCEACGREMYAQCHQYDYYGSRRHGGYAEFIDVRPWNLLKMPAAVSFANAATVEPLAVVLHALRRVGLADTLAANTDKLVCKQRIAIVGAGFLGLLMAQILHLLYAECSVTMIDRNQFKLDIAKKYAQQVDLLANETEWQHYLQQATAQFDIVFEATGAPTSFARSLALAAHSGTVVWMGNITGDLHLSQKIVSQILRKELQVIGTWNSIYRPNKPDDWKDALHLIAAGLNPSALITHWITLTELPEILISLYHHKTGKEVFPSIKAMIEV